MMKFIVSYSTFNVFSLMMEPIRNKKGGIDFKATRDAMREIVGEDAIVEINGAKVA